MLIPSGFGEWPPLPSNAGQHMISPCYRGYGPPMVLRGSEI